MPVSPAGPTTASLSNFTVPSAAVEPVASSTPASSTIATCAAETGFASVSRVNHANSPPPPTFAVAAYPVTCASVAVLSSTPLP